MNGLPWAGISLDAYACYGTPLLALGWGRSRGIHNTTSVLPKRRPGHGFAQLLVAVRGTSVPLGLCYAADPTAPGRGENVSGLPVPALLSVEERLSATDCRSSYLPGSVLYK